MLKKMRSSGVVSFQGTASCYNKSLFDIKFYLWKISGSVKRTSEV